jgi:anti-sigma factor RsiW
VSNSGSGEQHRPHRPAPAEQHLGDRLAAFVDGELTDDGRDRVQAHLATCTQCKAAATEQRRLKSVVAGSELPAISAGLMARLQGLPGLGGPDDRDGPADPPADSAERRRGPFDGGLLGSGPRLPGPDLSGSGLSGSGSGRGEFSYLGPAPDLVAAEDSRGRGFRIHTHDSASRGRRFAFAAAGAFSMAAIAIGSALPMEAAVDGGARPDDGPAVSPLSAGQVSDTRGVTPRGVLGVEERQRTRRAPVVVASATSVALSRPLLAPGVVPLVAPELSGSDSPVVLH